MGSAIISLGYTANSSQVLGRGFRSSYEPDATPIVYVLDEDASVRESLELLIRSEGWRSEAFASAHEFLRRSPAVVPNCLVLDVSLRGLNGLDVQKRVAIERPHMPVIFITDKGDVPTTVQAMKAGAIEFFKKPLQDDLLLSAIREALERSRIALGRESEMRVLRDRYVSLTAREKQVMALVVSGFLNKQVGGELGISEITVKAHRGQVMQKMKADSLPHLVNIAAKLGVAAVRSDKVLAVAGPGPETVKTVSKVLPLAALGPSTTKRMLPNAWRTMRQAGALVGS
jgi:FixJ family two-component response regulator